MVIGLNQNILVVSMLVNKGFLFVPNLYPPAPSAPFPQNFSPCTDRPIVLNHAPFLYIYNFLVNFPFSFSIFSVFSFFLQLFPFSRPAFHIYSPSPMISGGIHLPAGGNIFQ
jgi:hypothetical protein